jgi:SRSO17 transposase
MAQRFGGFCDVFSEHFVVWGRDMSQHARHYLSGLLGTQRRKNIGRIEEDVAGSNYQGMQQFITDSPWEENALLDDVAEEANALLGKHPDSSLLLDESGFVKKGNASVGVQRQYCGRVGKIENCQVGVFASLGRGERATLVDFRLFLPEAWVEDEERCSKARVPEAERRHRTKTQLALEMVEAAKRRGLSYQWIGGDEVYGNNTSLTDALDDMGEVFLMDVARNLSVWDRNPDPQPAPENSQGRPRTRRVAGEPRARSLSVSALVEEHFAKECREVTIRETTKGPLRAKIWVEEVWQWDGRHGKSRRRVLVVRQEQDGSFKYSLGNVPGHTRWERLAYMQAQRFWIERAFQDGKSELGMAQYEVRTWRGWHHHMALVCLAMLFLLKERITAVDHTPLLSARDIVELLAFYLPRRNRDPEEILNRLRTRHAQRQRSIDHHRRRSEAVTK